MTDWIIVETDRTTSTLYGPFLRKEDAEAWRDQAAFIGLTVHVIPHRMINVEE